MGLSDFFEKKSNVSVQMSTHEPSAREIKKQFEVDSKRHVQNFQKDASGLYPYEILLLSYLEKYSSGTPIAKFWEHEYNITNVPAMMKSLEKRGFASNGKLTISGKKAIADNPYVLFMHRHKQYGISLSEMAILVNSHPSTRFQDLLWGELNRRSLEYCKKHQWGFYRNTKFSMYRFLCDEKRYCDAFPLLCEVAFIDMNDMCPISLPPGIVKELQSILPHINYPDSEMVNQVYKFIRNIYVPKKHIAAKEGAQVIVALAFGNNDLANSIIHKYSR